MLTNIREFPYFFFAFCVVNERDYQAKALWYKTSGTYKRAIFLRGDLAMFTETKQSIRQNAEKIVLRAECCQFTTEYSAAACQGNNVVTTINIPELLKNAPSVS